MTLRINGREREVADGGSVLQIVEALGLKPATVVVEWNGRVLEREGFGEARPAEGDRLEIVRVVGGG
jgi:sulfur carrier protein